MSEAEDIVLSEMEALLPGDWVILHSLWLRNHPWKAHAEVDFILITDRAVLLLEVKGGVVWRDASGLWHFQTRSGSHTDTKREGPIDQVRGAYYTIKQHLRDLGRLDLFHDHVWGYGIITPDCAVTIPPSETSLDPDLWLDIRGFPSGLRGFVDRIADHWRHRCLEIKRNLGIAETTLRPSIPARLREQLCLLLQPVIQPVRGIGIESRQAEAEIRRLTLEQYRVLDCLSANDRILLTGSAGTGKTVLALEHAIRQAESAPDRRILLTCYSRLLAADLSSRLARVLRRGTVETGTYHQIFLRLLQRAGMDAKPPEDWRRFNDGLEMLVLEAVDRLTARGEFAPYDCLVVDEGQDLAHPAFFQSLGLLLRGGLEEGRWLVATDPTQAIFDGQHGAGFHDGLRSMAAAATLTVNCRNTRQIAAYVAGLADAGRMPLAGADGPEVRILYYDDLPAYRRLLRSTVNGLVGELDQGKLPPGDVLILTTDSAYLPAEIREGGYFVRPIVDAGEANVAGTSIRVSTVQAYKGLEAGCVVLVGLTDLDDRESRKLLYVGGSRARTVLRVLLPVSCSGQIQGRLLGVLQALSARSDAPAGRLC